jgi:hypothetical protein
MKKKTKTKTKTKPKQKWAGELGYVVAHKQARVAKDLVWMPQKMVVSLEGEKTGKLLVVCGWSAGASALDKQWPVDRLEANLARIAKEWTRDYGRGWKLEVVS